MSCVALPSSSKSPNPRQLQRSPISSAKSLFPSRKTNDRRSLSSTPSNKQGRRSVGWKKTCCSPLSEPHGCESSLLVSEYPPSTAGRGKIAPISLSCNHQHRRSGSSSESSTNLVLPS